MQHCTGLAWTWLGFPVLAGLDLRTPSPSALAPRNRAAKDNGGILPRQAGCGKQQFRC